MSKQAKILYKVVLTAIFAALAFAGTFINIPMPTGGAVHLGNFVVILAALLCGGIVGGVSGALGMGIYDWAIYYGYFGAGTIRTIILKLGMGLIVGFVFRLFVKKDIKTKPINYALLGLFTILFVLSILGIAFGPFTVGTRKVTFHWILPIFFGIIMALYIVVLIFGHKLKKITYIALTAISLGIVFNIFGEVFIKALLYYFIDSKYETFDAAYAYCLASLPSVAITSTLTCILGTLLYYPVYKATRQLNRLSFIELEKLEDDEQDELMETKTVEA